MILSDSRWIISDEVMHRLWITCGIRVNGSRSLWITAIRAREILGIRLKIECVVV